MVKVCVSLMSGQSVDIHLPDGATVRDLQEELHFSQRRATMFQTLLVGETKLEDMTRPLADFLEEGETELEVTLILSSEDPFKLLRNGDPTVRIEAIVALGVTFDEPCVEKLTSLALDLEDWDWPPPDELLVGAGLETIHDCIGCRSPEALAAANTLMSNVSFQVGAEESRLKMGIDILYQFTYANHPGVREYALKVLAELATGSARTLIMQYLVQDLKLLIEGRTMEVTLSGGEKGRAVWTNWRLASKYELFTRIANEDQREEANLLESMLKFALERPWVKLETEEGEAEGKRKRLSIEGRHVLLAPLLANVLGPGNPKLTASAEWAAKLEKVFVQHINFLCTVPVANSNALKKRRPQQKVLRDHMNSVAQVQSGGRSLFVRTMVPQGCTLGTLVPWITKLLDDPVPANRINGIELLVLFDKKTIQGLGEGVGKLKELWKDGAELWETALAALAKLAPDDREVWSDVAKVYRSSSDHWTQRSTIEFLQYSLVPEDLSIEILAEAAMSEQEDMARTAIQTIARRPSCLKNEALASLVSLTTSSQDAFVRKDAINALSKAEPTAEVLTALAEAVKKWNQDEYVRKAAVTALTTFAERDEAAAAALEACRNCNCLPTIKLIEKADKKLSRQSSSCPSSHPLFLKPVWAWASTNAQRIPARLMRPDPTALARH